MKNTTTKELIDSKTYISFFEVHPNAEPNYLKQHDGRYVCTLCTGWHKDTHIQKASIIAHYRKYHGDET